MQLKYLLLAIVTLCLTEGKPQLRTTSASTLYDMVAKMLEDLKTSIAILEKNGNLDELNSGLPETAKILLDSGEEEFLQNKKIPYEDCLVIKNEAKLFGIEIINDPCERIKTEHSIRDIINSNCVSDFVNVGEQTIVKTLDLIYNTTTRINELHSQLAYCYDSDDCVMRIQSQVIELNERIPFISNSINAVGSFIAIKEKQATVCKDIIVVSWLEDVRRIVKDFLTRVSDAIIHGDTTVSPCTENPTGGTRNPWETTRNTWGPTRDPWETTTWHPRETTTWYPWLTTTSTRIPWATGTTTTEDPWITTQRPYSTTPSC